MGFSMQGTSRAAERGLVQGGRDVWHPGGFTKLSGRGSSEVGVDKVHAAVLPESCRRLALAECLACDGQLVPQTSGAHMTAPGTPHPRLPLTLAACCPLLPSPLLLLSAGEGSSTEAAEQAIVTIGDKGRAQLQRVAPDQIRLSVADTYKDRVTFSQVGWGVGEGLLGCVIS